MESIILRDNEFKMTECYIMDVCDNTEINNCNLSNLIHDYVHVQTHKSNV